jgi:hypothetical protein
MCPEATGDDDDDHKPSKFFWGKPSPSTSSTEFEKIYFSSHKLPKQQSTSFWSQGILGVKAM